jgi:hypothetical protein
MCVNLSRVSSYKDWSRVYLGQIIDSNGLPVADGNNSESLIYISGGEGIRDAHEPEEMYTSLTSNLEVRDCMIFFGFIRNCSGKFTGRTSGGGRMMMMTDLC